MPETEDIALESLEEHHIVKWVLSELDGMDPEDERFDAKVTVLIENVRHHVEEEEEEYFPKVRDELGRNALGDLGDAMAAAKEVAPTHPHPRSPDTPPGNLVVGTAAGVVDRVGDTVNGVAQGGVAALGDLIATDPPPQEAQRLPAGQLHRPLHRRHGAGQGRRGDRGRDRSRQRGPADRQGHRLARPAARRSARPARPRAARRRRPRPPRPAPRAPSRAPARARSAPAPRPSGPPRRAKRNTRTASSGAKATATSARKAAKRTTTTAKRAATTTGRTARKAATSTKAAAKTSRR